MNAVMHKGWFQGIVSAPLATLLGAISIAITAAIALGIGTAGRLSTTSALGLFAAAILTVLAAGQASRPERGDGDERTQRPPPANRRDESSER